VGAVVCVRTSLAGAGFASCRRGASARCMSHGRSVGWTSLSFCWRRTGGRTEVRDRSGERPVEVRSACDRSPVAAVRSRHAAAPPRCHAQVCNDCCADKSHKPALAAPLAVAAPWCRCRSVAVACCGRERESEDGRGTSDHREQQQWGGGGGEEGGCRERCKRLHPVSASRRLCRRHRHPQPQPPPPSPPASPLLLPARALAPHRSPLPRHQLHRRWLLPRRPQARTHGQAQPLVPVQARAASPAPPTDPPQSPCVTPREPDAQPHAAALLPHAPACPTAPQRPPTRACATATPHPRRPPPAHPHAHTHTRACHARPTPHAPRLTSG
jgi:hypothetical protein